MNLQRILAVAHKEWRETVRDRIYFLLAFLLPVLLMLVFGYGMSQDVENVPLVVLDQDRSRMSRDYVHHFTDSRYFAFRGYLHSARQLDPLLADGRARLAVIIPPRFEANLMTGRQAQVQTLVDGTFTTSARTIQGYVEAINAAANAELQTGYLMRKAGIPADRAAHWLNPVRLEVRYLYNQEVKSIWAVAPALIMFILTLSTPLLMALSVVREKETGSIYNMYASTVSRGEYLLGKLLPNIGIAAINSVALWLLAVFWFGAPFKGGLAFFACATLLYIVCVSSIGLLISLLVRTQMAAMIISVVFSTIVSMQFSGLIAPVFSMSGANYVIAHLFPPMYFNTVLQGTFLKGVGLEVLWVNLLVFIAYGVGLWLLCHRLLRKRTRT